MALGLHAFIHLFTPSFNEYLLGAYEVSALRVQTWARDKHISALRKSMVKKGDRFESDNHRNRGKMMIIISARYKRHVVSRVHVTGTDLSRAQRGFPKAVACVLRPEARGGLSK